MNSITEDGILRVNELIDFLSKPDSKLFKVAVILETNKSNPYIISNNEVVIFCRKYMLNYIHYLKLHCSMPLYLTRDTCLFRLLYSYKLLDQIWSVLVYKDVHLFMDQLC